VVVFGMRPSAGLNAGRMIIAIVCVLGVVPVAAQEADQAAFPDPSPASTAADEAAQADAPLTPEQAAALCNALAIDPATLADGKPPKPLRLPNIGDSPKFDVSRADKPDGSGTLMVKQPLVGDWDAKVGADLDFAAPPPDNYRPGKPLPVTAGRQNSGVAWASVGLPNFASLDAQVDRTNDQGKFGTTIKKSITLGGRMSVAVQGSYSVTQTFSAPPATPFDVPLMTQPAIALATLPPQIWNNSKVVKLDLLATGTTLSAGLATASNDPVTHNRLSAEQKLNGPLHVTTAVTDVGQPSSNKSIAASLKLNW
jgi:hypothetical protein